MKYIISKLIIFRLLSSEMIFRLLVSGIFRHLILISDIFFGLKQVR